MTHYFLHLHFRQDGIVCIAVGVGSYDVNELLDIAGHNPSLIYEVDDFDALISFTSNITDTICAIGEEIYLKNNPFIEKILYVFLYEIYVKRTTYKA